MEKLKYQLILTSKDKMVIISFLLPIIMAILVSILTNSSLTSTIELKFGIVNNNLSYKNIETLSKWGEIFTYKDINSLKNAIKNPSSEIIGVYDNEPIITFISGDETSLTKDVAAKIPTLLTNTLSADNNITYRTIARENIFNTFKIPLITMTIITAIYMGCVFNAMNIIMEKEDGITIVNDILPMTYLEYLIQKILIGFLGGIITAFITIFICLPPTNFMMFVKELLIITISSYISSIVGLFIGNISESVLVGIVYLKIILLVFIAAPFAAYMLLPPNTLAKFASYIIPSCISFDSIVASITGTNAFSSFLILGLLIYAVTITFIFILTKKHLFRPKIAL